MILEVFIRVLTLVLAIFVLLLVIKKDITYKALVAETLVCSLIFIAILLVFTKYFSAP